MGLKQHMGELVKQFENVLFCEHKCFACSKEKFNDYSCFCEDCEKELPHIVGKTCKKCGMPMIAEGDFCITCKNCSYDFDEARASFLYADAPAKLVHDLKYLKKQYLAKYLARYMATTYEKWGISTDYIIPVPLFEDRKIERGFNQSELIAEELSKIIGVPVMSNLLLRIRATETQTNKTREERRENLKGAFEIYSKDVEQKNLNSDYIGKSFLIVDDVFTTGTTINECSKVLRQVNPAKIYALTPTKTLIK